MGALEHTHPPPSLAPRPGDWWSPLALGDAAGALLKLGALAVTDARGGTRYEIGSGKDVFAPAVAFEVTELGRGCNVRVRDVEASFGRDFARMVHLMLGGFAGLIFCSTALRTEGDAFLRAVVAIVLVWAVFMGLFAGARALMAVFSGQPAALQDVRAKARVVLFAQGR